MSDAYIDQRCRLPRNFSTLQTAELTVNPRAHQLRTPGSRTEVAVNMYARFLAMIVTSTLVMYGLMYLNTYELDHVFFSETRAYMALIMGAVMAGVMLAFMRAMLTKPIFNGAIVVVAAIVFVASLWLVRSQSTVDDVSYMRAMIPHHSIAIMTSERARITDARVRKLADGIIASQKREIEEMRLLIQDLKGQ